MVVRDRGEGFCWIDLNREENQRSEEDQLYLLKMNGRFFTRFFNSCKPEPSDVLNHYKEVWLVLNSTEVVPRKGGEVYCENFIPYCSFCCLQKTITGYCVSERRISGVGYFIATIRSHGSASKFYVAKVGEKIYGI